MPDAQVPLVHGEPGATQVKSAGSQQPWLVPCPLQMLPGQHASMFVPHDPHAPPEQTEPEVEHAVSFA